ncbi:MAG: hypothetical protein V3V09_07415 [Arenicellales bacterium]
MEALLPLIIQLISGAAGGNIIGKLFSGLSLGGSGNTIAGLIGGLGGAKIAGLAGLASMAGGGGMDMASIIGQVAGGAGGGGALMLVAGIVKKLLGK